MSEHRFRRRSFEVIARQLTFEDRRDVCQWVHGRLREQMSLDRATGETSYSVSLAFLDNTGTIQTVRLGQWIVLLDSGQVRVLDDDVFQREFSPADEMPILHGRRED